MNRRSGKRWMARWLSLFPLVLACNAILDNDPRTLVDGEDGDGDGGTFAAPEGSGGSGGSASNSQGAGAAGADSGGEAGLDASAGSAGEGPSASSGGQGGDPGSGGGKLATTSAWGTDGTEWPMSCEPEPAPATEETCCATGIRTRTVTLNKQNCAYSVGEWSACSVPENCSPGSTQGCPNGDQCGVVRCSDACTWGACEPKDGAECLYLRPVDDKAGSNYLCCDTPGQWRFCAPGCYWYNCGNCVPGSPDWCEC